MSDADIQIEFPKEATRELYQKAIDELFEKAKKADEREFIVANFYFSGLMQVNDNYDIKKELDKTLSDFIVLFANPGSFSNEGLRIKFLILLYCHILEFYLFYIFIYGLLDICSGESFDYYAFKKPAPNYSELTKRISNALEKGKNDLKKINMILPICKPLFSDKMTNWQKINKIDVKSKSNQSEVGRIIKSFYNNELRNAFSHNSYTVSSKDVSLTDCHKLLPIHQVAEQIVNCFHFYQYLSFKSGEVMRLLTKNQNSKFTGKYGTLAVKAIKEEDGKFHFSIESSSTGKTF